MLTITKECVHFKCDTCHYEYFIFKFCKYPTRSNQRARAERKGLFYSQKDDTGEVRDICMNCYAARNRTFYAVTIKMTVGDITVCHTS